MRFTLDLKISGYCKTSEEELEALEFEKEFLPEVQGVISKYLDEKYGFSQINVVDGIKIDFMVIKK